MISKDEIRPPSKAELQKARRIARKRFQRAHRAERAFAKSLRAVARQIGSITNVFAPSGKMTDFSAFNDAMKRYSQLLKPWAAKVSEAMIADVGQRDKRAWEQTAAAIGQTLKKEVSEAPTGGRMLGLMNEQVELITSLPLDAAQRVHKLIIEGMSDGTRAEQTAKLIMRTGEVSKSRAMLIARTETTRTATAMTQARAEFIGADQYIWRTAGDADVREAHKKLNGKVFSWSDPPVAGENGERAHPGAIYNCRCFPEPIIPENV